MQKPIRYALFLCSLCLPTLLLPQAAWGGDPTYIIHINLPFRFRVSDKKFRSGEYELVSKAPGLVFLCDPQGRILTTALARAVEVADAPGATKLMFRKHGKRFDLAQIWVENRRYGQQLYGVDEPIRLGKPQMITPGLSFEAFPGLWHTAAARR
jgi:hypothetical protein